MKRHLMLFLTLARLAVAEVPINYNAITNFEGEPNNFVNNVDIITGNYCENIIDLVVPGAEPLCLQRFYSSGNVTDRTYGVSPCGGSFTLNYGASLTTEDEGNVKKAYLLERNGNVCHFQGKIDYQANCYKMHIVPKTYEHGHTNCGKGVISGQNNIKNIRVYYNVPVEDEFDLRLHSRVQYGSGKVREFIEDLETKTCLPNGNAIVFEYDNKILKKIKSVNSSGKKIASLTYQHESTKSKKYSEWEITTSDNRSVKYKLKYHADSIYLLDEVISSDAPKVKYKWNVFSMIMNRKAGSIKRIDYPEDRYVEIEYQHDTDVKKLYQPVGKDERPIVTYRFDYENGEGKKKTVNVKDAESNLTRYECDHGRVQQITRHQGDKVVLNSEKCYWGKPDTPDHTNLISRTISDSQNRILLCRHLKYDANGNVVKEKLYGNLTGKNDNKFPIVDENGNPNDQGCDCYVKEYTHTTDGFNLVLSEKDNRCKTTYTYYPNRDLLKSKFVWDNDRIAIRNFYEYDENGVIICEIQDNGSSEDRDDLGGVTERRIKRVKVRTEQSPVGAPNEIELKYLDLATGYERLLHRTINDYTPQGRLKEQHHYDSENGYLYSLFWEYDGMGHVTRETNALGYITERRYDANGNLIYEQGPRSDVHSEFRYDFSNRLIAKERVLNDGTRLGEYYKYNYLSQKVGSTDLYGNETSFTYDALNHVTSTTLPETLSEEGSTVLKYTYDALGNRLTSTDGKGFLIETLHTARGKPYLIKYPDGTAERNEYSIDGLLVKNINRFGLITQYEYDYQGRVLKEESVNNVGTILAKKTYQYNAFHIVCETDANGNQITYHYDGAGRLIRSQKDNQISDIEYDTCGRMVRNIISEAGKPETAIIQTYKYDLVDRKIEEGTEDFSGLQQRKVQSAYDESGNLVKVTTFSEAGKAETLTHYDAWGNVVKVVGPTGDTTVIRYDYEFINELGQYVGLKETIDPVGNVTQEIHDTLGRVAQVISKNKMGKVIQKSALKYDKNNNRKQVEHTVIGPNVPDRTVVTSWNYNACDQVTSIIDALGTTDQKQTSFKYNALGQKEIIIKPNGIKLTHTYDAMGRLKELSSSDKNLQYHYTYDMNGNCTRVDDVIHQTATTRVYNSFGKITQETLENGLTLKYDIDVHGRPLRMELPDQTAVSYSYEGAYLKELTRLKANQQELYHHTYLAYDQSGQVLSSQLPFKAGQLEFTYDLCGRTKTIRHPKWTEEVPDQGYDKVGNLLKVKTIDSVGSINHEFAYDDLYQLKSEKGVATHTYSHDSLYNRLDRDNKKNKVNNLNQILSDTNRGFTYDLNGNLALIKNASGNIKLLYDPLDRVIEVTTDKGTVKYQYDAFNRRIARTANDQTQRYLYCGENECGSVNESGDITEFRLLGIGKGAEIGAAVAIELKHKVYIPIHNHQGNVMVLLKPDGSVFETYRYNAFGEEFLYNSSSQETQTLNPWRFSSKRVDSETGFVFFGRRCYDPSLGRWLTRDPKGYDAGPNLYAYVMNSPLSRLDFYGLIMMVQEGNDWVPRTSEHDRSPHHISREVSQALADRRATARAEREPFFRGTPSKEGEVSSDKSMVGTLNGITTKKETLKERAGFLSKVLGGIEIIGYYIEEHGAIMDIIHNTWVRFGGSTSAVTGLTKLCKEFIKEAIDKGIEPIILLEVHSNAGRITKAALDQLTETERSYIHIRSYGSTCIFPKGYVRTAVNYINKGDYVPVLADTGGMIRSMIDPDYADIRYMPGAPEGGFMSNHSYETCYSEARAITQLEFSYLLNR